MDAVRKEKLGQKWTCFECGSKFYDLNRPEPLCPKCGKSQKDSPVFEVVKRPKAKRGKAKPKAKAGKDAQKASKPIPGEKETGLKLSNEEQELDGTLDAKLDGELDDGIDDDLEIDIDGDAPPDPADIDEAAEEEPA